MNGNLSDAALKTILDQINSGPFKEDFVKEFGAIELFDEYLRLIKEEIERMIQNTGEKIMEKMKELLEQLIRGNKSTQRTV